MFWMVLVELTVFYEMIPLSIFLTPWRVRPGLRSPGSFVSITIGGSNNSADSGPGLVRKVQLSLNRMLARSKLVYRTVGVLITKTDDMSHHSVISRCIT